MLQLVRTKESELQMAKANTPVSPKKNEAEARSPDPPPTWAQTEETAGTLGDAISIVDSGGEHNEQTVTDAGQAVRALPQATTNDDGEMSPSDLSEDEKDLHEYLESYLELMR